MVKAVVERTNDGWALANFGSVTFHGVGMTDNGVYRPMGGPSNGYGAFCGYGNGAAPHDHAIMYATVDDVSPWKGHGDILANVDPIAADCGDVPYDQLTIRWQHAV
jgi:hypothetical protein